MSASTVEYVSEADTIADIALQHTQSTSLRTSSAILLSLLFIASFILNLVLITAILTGRKLRAPLFRRLLCLLCGISLLCLFAVVLPSLLFVANGSWTLGIQICRANAFIQQFCALHSVLLLVTMALERASTVSQPPLPLFGERKTIGILVAGFAISLCCTVPSVVNFIPIKAYQNRYLCAIDERSPIYYSAAQTVVYIVCLVAMVFCTGAIYSRKQVSGIPQHTHEYSQFITRTRALQEDTILGKLVVRLFCAFMLLEGPYIVLSLYVQVASSAEIRASSPTDVPQDVDTLLTWLMFVFPLLAPIIIFCSCADIWSQVLETFCCKSQDPPTIGQYYMGGKNNAAATQVMTIVATPQGLQLKMPSYAQYPFSYQQPSVPEPLPPYNNEDGVDPYEEEYDEEPHSSQRQTPPQNEVESRRVFNSKISLKNAKPSANVTAKIGAQNSQNSRSKISKTTTKKETTKTASTNSNQANRASKLKPPEVKKTSKVVTAAPNAARKPRNKPKPEVRWK